MTQAPAVIEAKPAFRAVESDALEAIDLVKQHDKIREAMEEAMKPGLHYGMVYKEDGSPAFKKPMLLKAGAEMLCKLFHLRPHYEELGAVHRDNLIGYRFRCVLVHFPTGIEIAEGLGSCNSRERKYKKEEAWNIDNTLVKMAAKRALMAAVLVGTAASDIFTTDQDKTSTEWHRILNARAVDLDREQPREDKTSWVDWTREEAKKRWGIESRSELDAEQLQELVNILDAEAIPFG